MTATVHQLTAVEITTAIAEGRLSTLEVTRGFLERIEALNPVLNAVCTVDPRAEDQARAIDARRARGEAPRLLEGVPFVVKDNLETADLRTTYGSALEAGNVPDADALCVARLRAAGGVLLGKTNTPEFAADINTDNPVFGQTRNPWDLNTTPGGSSGGTGAAVAAGFAPVGLGTDLGGSIRIPASFNGLCGIRPCPGRVPVYPQDFAWETLIPHVHGPLARSVADLGRALAALAGPDERDPLSLPDTGTDFLDAATARDGLSGARVGFVGDLDGLVPVDPQVMALARDAAGRFEAAGARVDDAILDAREVPQIIAGTRAFNVLARLEPRYLENAAVLTAPIVNQVKAAQTIDLRTVIEAERLRTVYWHRVRTLMERFDFLLLPVVGVPAFRLDEPLPDTVAGKPVTNFYDVVLSTYAFSLLGLPVLAVPAGFSDRGMPVGVQIVGHRHREDAVLAAGAAYEATCPQLFNRIPDIDPSQARPPHAGFAMSGVPVIR